MTAARRFTSREAPAISSPAELAFWFEFGSPYSYVAAMRIEGLCATAGVPLQWQPFLLGPVFKLQGYDTSPFNVHLQRGAYMFRDLERLCAKYDIPWRKPSVFPRAAVLPARVAAANSGAPWLPDFVRATYVANFGDDREINDETVVAETLTACGEDAVSVIAAAESPEQRTRLRENTERAIELGIFGAPNCIVAGELFWGEETLEDAIEWAASRSD